MRFVVLLRGVNLGPSNRVRMPDLRAALEEAGFADVRTVLQSGNVVAGHDGDSAAVGDGVRTVLRDAFGVDVGVVVRDEDELRAIVADDPLADVATDGSRRFFVFCSEIPDPALLPEATAPERLVVRGRELHLWCPDGVRESRLMTALGRRPPAPVTTFRNGNTVQKLAGLLEG